MLKIAIKKCNKYLVYFEKRLDIGAPHANDEGKFPAREGAFLAKMKLDILNAYAKSLIRFHLFPLYAAGILSREQLTMSVGSAIK